MRSMKRTFVIAWLVLIVAVGLFLGGVALVSAAYTLSPWLGIPAGVVFFTAWIAGAIALLNEYA